MDNKLDGEAASLFDDIGLLEQSLGHYWINM